MATLVAAKKSNSHNKKKRDSRATRSTFTTDAISDGKEAPDATKAADITAIAIDSNHAATSAKKPKCLRIGHVVTPCMIKVEVLLLFKPFPALICRNQNMAIIRITAPYAALSAEPLISSHVATPCMNKVKVLSPVQASSHRSLSRPTPANKRNNGSPAQPALEPLIPSNGATLHQTKNKTGFSRSFLGEYEDIESEQENCRLQCSREAG